MNTMRETTQVYGTTIRMTTSSETETEVTELYMTSDSTALSTNNTTTLDGTVLPTHGPPGGGYNKGKLLRLAVNCYP